MKASRRESAGAAARSRPADGGRAGAQAFDWGRLEHAVGALVEQQDRLRGQLDERDVRIRRLEAQLLEANQLRQDTAKRIDELISELDQLDEQLAGLESAE